MKTGALRRSSRKRVALLDMEVCRDLYELDTDSDCCSSDERGYSEPGSDSGSGKESSRDVDVDERLWPLNENSDKEVVNEVASSEIGEENADDVESDSDTRGMEIDDNES